MERAGSVDLLFLKMILLKNSRSVEIIKQILALVYEGYSLVGFGIG